MNRLSDKQIIDKNKRKTKLDKKKEENRITQLP